MNNPRHNIRDVRAPQGTELNAKSWMTEAPLRMLCLLYTSPSPRDS